MSLDENDFESWESAREPWRTPKEIDKFRRQLAKNKH